MHQWPIAHHFSLFACVWQLDMRKRIKGNLYFQGEGSEEAKAEDVKATAPATQPSR